MVQKLETIFKEKVLADLRKIPRLWCVKVQQVAIRGTPDILCCAGGVFVAVELKKDARVDPDPLQDYTLERIKKAGGWTFVAHPGNWTDILEKIGLLTLMVPDARLLSTSYESAKPAG